MRALCDRLGNPERSFRSLHIVGTNGKSSVALMTAALLTRAGLLTGTCISPHALRWSQRTRIDRAEIAAPEFADSVAEVAEAIDGLEAELGDDQRITQFEAAIAASFVAFRRAGVEIAAVEAGLGGRLDATNVIPSEATALTSVGLDHTEWLGETPEEIVVEKLAVLRPGTTLITGRLEEGVARIARAHAAELDAELIDASGAEPERGADDEPELRDYRSANAAVATALAELVVGSRIEPEEATAALGGLELPGRLELIDGDPPLLLDAAHNAEGAAALARALPSIAGGRPVFACISLLADKDADAISAALAPEIEHIVATAATPGRGMGRPGAVPAAPDRLAATFSARGVDAEAVADPVDALARVRALARDGHGVALIAGSHYLLRYVWTERRDPNYSR